jgi:hypothetical protein
VITEDHRDARLLTDAGQLFLLEATSVADGQVSATIVAHAGYGETFFDGSEVAYGILAGSISDRARIEADWVLESGDLGSMVLEYDSVYERGSDLARLAGTWSASDGTVFSIDASGEIFAQRESGCVYDGNIRIVDASYNVYRVRIMDHCRVIRVDGTGMLTDFAAENDAFVILLSRCNWIFADALLRQ